MERAMMTELHTVNEDLYDLTAKVLSQGGIQATVYMESQGRLVLKGVPALVDGEAFPYPQTLNLSATQMAEVFDGKRPLIIEDVERMRVDLPRELQTLPKQVKKRSAAYLPVFQFGKLGGMVVLLSEHEEGVEFSKIQAQIRFARHLSESLDLRSDQGSIQDRIARLEALNKVSSAIGGESDLEALYPIIHQQITELIGEVVFFIALYDPKSEHISFPYVFEEGGVQRIDPIPLGEGLTSIVVRKGQPLMLVENTEARAMELGAKIIGPSAKSWMGVPLKVQDEVIGIMALQDAENEQRFNEDDLSLVSELADQMSGAIRNARLLEQSQRYAFQLQTAAEIARETSATIDRDELLVKAINLVKERFGFYHASVFLMDEADEYAVVKESTGEAGREMKERGHQLKKGSQSIIGYVTQTGETLVINDVTNDPLHKINPLLPETKAEVGIPMKVGNRVVGALDVQSVQLYSFSRDDIEVLEILADQLAIAVVNAELFMETQEHLAQHRMIQQITHAAASSGTLEEALRTAVQGLRSSMGDRVSILLLDATSRRLEVGAQAGYGEEALSMRIEPGQGVTGWVAMNREAQLVNNVELDPRYISVDENVKSELAVPLIFRDELLGVLNMENDRYGAYSQDDLDILTTVAGSIASIIVNTRLWQRQRQLFEVTNKIQRSTDMSSILETTANELNRILKTRQTKIEVGMQRMMKESDKSEPAGNGKGEIE